MVFPRLGCDAGDIAVPKGLESVVHVVTGHRDRIKLSSTEMRKMMAAGVQVPEDHVHPAVVAKARELGLYAPLHHLSPDLVVVLLTGPHGCGKGTVAQRLSVDHGFLPLSVGDFFRVQTASSEPPEGAFFRDCLMLAIERARAQGHTRFAVDGFLPPDTVVFERALGAACNMVVHLRVESADTLVQRMRARERPGETIEKITHRTDTYLRVQGKYAEAVETYREHRPNTIVLNVDASGDLASTLVQILPAVTTMLATAPPCPATPPSVDFAAICAEVAQRSTSAPAPAAAAEPEADEEKNE